MLPPPPRPIPAGDSAEGRGRPWREVSPTHGALALPCWPTRPAPHPGSGSRKKKARGEVRLEACTLLEPDRRGQVPSLPQAPGQRLSRPCPQGAARPVGQPGQWGRLREPGSAHAWLTLTRNQTPAPPVPGWGALLGGSGETPPSSPPSTLGPQAGTPSFTCANKAHPPGEARSPHLSLSPHNTEFAPGKFCPPIPFNGPTLGRKPRRCS